MKSRTLLIIYNLIVCLAFTIAGSLTAKTNAQLINSLIFLPIALYFLSTLLKQISRNRAIKVALSPTIAEKNSIAKVETKVPREKIETPEILDETDASKEDVPDSDRRAFLKLIASSGIIVFLFALFTKRAQAAFFGSVPGPGTVSIKNSAGTVIDPAEKSPTDGYEITQIDDSSSPAYFGFVRKDGAWFVMREDNTGGYRYVKGTSNFSTNWTNRASLIYDYYNIVFA